MRKVKVPEPDFIQRTVTTVYRDKDGNISYYASNTVNEPTETYNKRLKQERRKSK